MSPRSSITRAVLALTFVAGAASDCSPPPKYHPRPPNVVFIVVDTLRYDHTNPDDNRANTPNLQKLARDGVVFPNAFAHAPITLPSHTSIFSSRLPSETGVRNNGQGVPPELPLVAAWLSANGFAAQAAVSMASMWPAAGGRGLDRGFERYDKGAWSMTRGEDLNVTLDATLDELAARPPFFLFAHYSDPHEPYDAHGSIERFARLGFDGRDLGATCTSEMSEARREIVLSPGEHHFDLSSEQAFKIRSFECTAPDVDVQWQFTDAPLHKPIFGTRIRVVNPSNSQVTASVRVWLHDAVEDAEIPIRYRAEVEYADACVGKLIAGLKRRGLYDTSVIVFTSDHGEALGEHSTYGHIVNLYDELLHVPLIMKLPSAHAARPWLEKSKNELVRGIDLVPTILDALGLPPLPGQRGESLLAAPREPRVLYAQTERQDGSTESFCVRDREFKMIYTPGTKRFELYDLAKDPGELGDVYATEASQRPAWTPLLESLAGRAPRGGEKPLDPEARKRLEELGY